MATLTWLAFGWAYPAFPAETSTSSEAPPAANSTSSYRLAPIATGFGGNVGYVIEQRSINGASPTLQQRVVLNLKGKAITYISRPWIAQVKGNVDFLAQKNKLNDHSSGNNSVSGDVGLYLVPYSQYPFTAVVKQYQNYSGQGLGSLSSETTRLDMTQMIVPRKSEERYNFGYYYAQTKSRAPETFTQNGASFNMSSTRFDHQTLTVAGIHRSDKQHNAGNSTQLNQALVQHKYTPSSRLTVGSNATVRNSSEKSPYYSRNFVDRQINSTMHYQPRSGDYTIIGTVRAQAQDIDYQEGSSQLRVGNANLSASYRWSNISFSAGMNANVTDNGVEKSYSLSTNQSARTNYQLASFNLGSYHYSSRVGAGITNSTRSHERTSGTSRVHSAGSSQSISISPGHGLSRRTSLYGGSLSLRIDQSLSASESTRSQATARLSHSANADWHRSRTSLSLTSRDSRSLNSNQSSFQSVALNAGISEELSRDSSLSANLSIQTTRQISTGSESGDTSTNSVASMNYTNQRLFGIPRLSFLSFLRAYSRAPIPALAASPNDQGPIFWENSLIYLVGKLSTDLKVALSKEGDGSSQSLIRLSIKRYF